MRAFIHLVLALVTALVVGFGLSYLALESSGLFGTFRLGPWVAWTEVGSPQPDPYTRAYASRSGALQLARAEGIKFVAERDSDGVLLDRSCTYRIDGTAPVSAFWTLTATDKNATIITRSNSPMAINSQRLARANDGTAIIRVGAQLAAGNWLEIQGEGSFQLVLTLYDTSIFSGFGTEVNALPSILREAC